MVRSADIPISSSADFFMEQTKAANKHSTHLMVSDNRCPWKFTTSFANVVPALMVGFREGRIREREGDLTYRTKRATNTSHTNQREGFLWGRGT